MRGRLLAGAHDLRPPAKPAAEHEHARARLVARGAVDRPGGRVHANGITLRVGRVVQAEGGAGAAGAEGVGEDMAVGTTRLAHHAAVFADLEAAAGPREAEGSSARLLDISAGRLIECRRLWCGRLVALALLTRLMERAKCARARRAACFRIPSEALGCGTLLALLMLCQCDRRWIGWWWCGGCARRLLLLLLPSALCALRVERS